MRFDAEAPQSVLLAMSNKSARTKRAAALRYTEEDLRPRNESQEADFVDDFFKRNRAVLSAALKQARASIKRGNGTKITSHEEFLAAIARGGKTRKK
jgi:hypothetical protein